MDWRSASDPMPTLAAQAPAPLTLADSVNSRLLSADSEARGAVCERPVFLAVVVGFFTAAVLLWQRPFFVQRRCHALAEPATSALAVALASAAVGALAYGALRSACPEGS